MVVCQVDTRSRAKEFSGVLASRHLSIGPGYIPLWDSLLSPHPLQPVAQSAPRRSKSDSLGRAKKPALCSLSHEPIRTETAGACGRPRPPARVRFSHHEFVRRFLTSSSLRCAPIRLTEDGPIVGPPWAKLRHAASTPQRGHSTAC